jgi:Fur family ferric uptake transcriptional regulator
MNDNDSHSQGRTLGSHLIARSPSGHSTKSSRLVHGALSDLERAISAQELYRLLHGQGADVGLASVYRALDGLVSAGQAERLRGESEDVYVLCPPQHHHHAICRDCGRTDILRSCSLAQTEPTRSEHGFYIDAHQTVFYGRCPGCIGGETM